MDTLSWLVDDSLSTRLTMTLMHFLWQGCCVGLAVWICGAFLGGATARMRYCLSVACLVAMAACLPATFLLISSRVETTTKSLALQPPHTSMPNASGAVESSAHPPEYGLLFPSQPMRMEEPSSARDPADEMAKVVPAVESIRPIPSEWGPSLSKGVLPALSRWIAPLYLIGVACILSRLVLGVWGGHRLRRLSIPIEDDALLASLRKLASRVGLRVMPTVAWCEQISVPVVVGIVRPMILLPLAVVSSLTPDQVQALMLHELSHIRRYDPIVNLLQRIVEAILFFHPVVWFVSRRISIERELAADDMVLAAGWDRPLYADALVRMAELASVISGRSKVKHAAALAATGRSSSEFKLRILRLLDASRPPEFVFSRSGILLALILVLVAGVFAWSKAQPPAGGGDRAGAAAADPDAPVKPHKEKSEPPADLEFLKPYPALHGLSLDMTEPTFLELVKQQKLKTGKTVVEEQSQYHLGLGDGHTLIVMFDKDGMCRGIQRIRGEDEEAGRLVAGVEGDAKKQARGKDAAGGMKTLRKPELLLPDHWILLAVGFDNDEKELITVSTQSVVTIRRWDLVGKKLLSEIKLEGDKQGRAFRGETVLLSGDRKRVLLATDAYVGIWEIGTGKLLTTLPIPKVGDNDTVRRLTCTPDFSVIVGTLETNYLRTTLVYDAYTVVWDGTTGKLLRTNTHKQQNILTAISLSADGKRLATTNGGGAIIWDPHTGEQLLTVENAGRKGVDPKALSIYSDQVWSVQLSPSGKQLALGDTLGVKLLDAASGKLLQQLDNPYRYSSGPNPDLVFSSDGQWLARLGTRDKVDGERTGYVIPIWSTQTGQERFELHTNANVAAFSADAQRFAVGFSDFQQALALWTLGEKATDAEQPAGPGPESRQDKVDENGHYRGKTAAEFIDKFKPTWGEAKQGVQYGIALTKPQDQYRSGERVPLVVFFRNTSDQPLTLDMRPDYYGNTPKVVDTKRAALEFVNVPLLGDIAHYVEPLQPGEAVGPFYLSFGVGENPLPGKQHWHPFYKAPIAGKYTLTHTVALQVKDGDKATDAEVTTGTLAFEIVDGGKPAEPAPKETGAAVVADPTLSLASVVRDFNAENKRLQRGLDQPALTAEEIIAFIRGSEWKRDAADLNEKEFAAFKAVAESGRLPEGSYLQVYTEQARDTFVISHFWQVRLMLPAIGHDGFVGLTIRDTKISEEKIDPRQVAWGKPDADGLSLGIYLSPKMEKYAIGERARLNLFVRNEGRQEVETSWANTTHPMPEDFTITDAKGVKVAVRKGKDGNWELPWISGYLSGSLGPGDAHRFEVPFEVGIGGDGANKLVGRVIEARPGQTLQLQVQAPTGTHRERKPGEGDPKSGTLTFDVSEVAPAPDDKAAPVKPGDSAKSEGVLPKDRPNYVKVIGQLLDAETGKPIEKASWESGMASLKKPTEVAWGHSRSMDGSYPDGRFEQLVHFSPDGQFDRLRVYAAGYETAVVVEDLPNPRPLQVGRIVRLKRGRAIKGTLRDHAGNAVAGGRVFFIPSGHRSNIVEGIPGADAYSLSNKPRDGAVSEARTNGEGQFVLAAGSAGTLAASTDAVDLWPFPLPGGDQAELKMPEPAQLVIDLSYWYLDLGGADRKEELSLQNENPEQYFIRVLRTGTELPLAYNTVMAEAYVKAGQLWSGCQYDRQMFVFSTDRAHTLSKGVRVSDRKDAAKPKLVAEPFRNRSVSAQVTIQLPPGSYQVLRYRAGQIVHDERDVVLSAGGAKRLDWTRAEGAAVRGTVAMPANSVFVRQEGEAPRKLDWSVPHSATVKTPFEFDDAKGSWQDGAFEAQVLLTLGMVRQQDRVVKALIKIVDRSEAASMDQRRLAMMYLGGKAPKQLVPLLIKELETAVGAPQQKFVPYHEIAVLGQIGVEAADAIPVLVKLLDYPDGLAAQESLLALVKVGPSSTMVMNEIAKRFGDPDKEVWSRAVYVGDFKLLGRLVRESAEWEQIAVTDRSPGAKRLPKWNIGPAAHATQRRMFHRPGCAPPRGSCCLSS